MGFLDGIIKSATKKIVSEVVDNVVDDVVSNIRGNNGTEGSNEGLKQSATSSLTNTSANVETIQFQPATMSDLVTRHFDFYTGDENGNDIVLDCQLQLPEEFISCGNMGAAELDESYVYSPEDVKEGYVEESDGKPMIYIGDDGYTRSSLDNYLKNGKIAAGVKISKVEGSFVKYKTEFEKNNTWYMVYHFNRMFDSENLYQIVLCYPKKYKGTDMGKEMEQALDCVISTYKETEKQT